jgi:succinate dehydrogenase/fumarate reductase-like Fe-S protein
MSNYQLNVNINGKDIAVPTSMSAIQAVWHAGYPMVHGVGCLEGVCGACKVLVRRACGSEITTELGCQTMVEDGMQVIFLAFPTENHHSYHLSDFKNSWVTQAQFHQVYPEASQCRNCGGCTESCPKDIEVEKGVELAVEGKFREAGELFLECVMCGLCLTSCPERITPNHVGLFCRRISAYFHIRPSNLIHRLEEIRKGHYSVEIGENEGDETDLEY